MALSISWPTSVLGGEEILRAGCPGRSSRIVNGPGPGQRRRSRSVTAKYVTAVLVRRHSASNSYIIAEISGRATPRHRSNTLAPSGHGASRVRARPAQGRGFLHRRQQRPVGRFCQLPTPIPRQTLVVAAAPVRNRGQAPNHDRRCEDEDSQPSHGGPPLDDPPDGR